MHKKIIPKNVFSKIRKNCKRSRIIVENIATCYSGERILNFLSVYVQIPYWHQPITLIFSFSEVRYFPSKGSDMI